MKILLISALITFFAVLIPHLRVSPDLIRPVIKKQNILERIKPKLEIKSNDFHLKKDFIPLVSAGSEFDALSAYALVDVESGQVIASKNLSKKLPMASLTKIMTAIVALDLAKPDEQFRVTREAAAATPTKVMLKEGEHVSLLHLLEYMLISSANDSAMAIKDGIDQKFGNGVFIQAMNEKAKILGLKNTHFTNPAGFDNPEAFSSPEDLSILSIYALRNYPLVVQIVEKETLDLTDGGRDMRFYLQNWNGLLGVYPGVVGVKIGNTPKAGSSTIVFSKRGEKKLLAVTLGAPGVLERDLWTAQLLDLGFNKVAGLVPINLSEGQLKAKYASWQYFQ